MLIDQQELREASKEELIAEHDRLREDLVMDSSAVKTEEDLVRSLTMEFIRTLLKELHGMTEGEAIQLNNPS